MCLKQYTLVTSCNVIICRLEHCEWVWFSLVAQYFWSCAKTKQRKLLLFGLYQLSKLLSQWLAYKNSPHPSLKLPADNKKSSEQFQNKVHSLLSYW